MAQTPKKTAAKAAPRRSTTRATAKKPEAAAKPREVKKTVVSTKNVAVHSAEGASVQNAPDRASSGIEVRKGDLVDRMMAASGMKKGEARRALEASLAVLGAALREGHDINAAPLGKIKITRQKETQNGRLAICRVKLKKAD
ncbi:HU family DNA-binding protein [Litoreibacter roseus]|uniref:DNA-binding protein n=1 Tax=Litoreibacter roseus TaxID=2601869 RepID=A0A6N6JC77_9RHOB|nr:HU family DNA-binding protein [Litoreibacter roseus]GFE63684.1 hypothetical protein KIN_07580 [Litoreibacter roseus]